VDAQIKSLDWGSIFVGEGPLFGIIIGVDCQNNGYLCGSTWGKYIEHIQDWSDVGITDYSESDAEHPDFSQFVTVMIKIQKHVLTLFFNDQQVAQATLPSYHTASRHTVGERRPLRLPHKGRPRPDQTTTVCCDRV
jgi:hypothetical protein